MKLASENQVGLVDEASSESLDSIADFNIGIILRAPARYVEDHHGKEKLGELIEAAGLRAADLEGDNHWGSVEQIEVFLDRVYDLVGRDEKAFLEAAGYKLAKTMGPARFVLRAASPKFLFERIVKDFHIVSTISQNHLVDLSETSCSLKYTTTKPESRLLCLSRQATSAGFPAIWGLPKAEFSEGSCVARGDDCCEYHYRWYRHQRLLWPLTGLLAGIATFLIGYSLGLGTLSFLSGLAFSLPLIGYLIELWKTNRSNLLIGDAMTAETRDLLHADVAARREIMLLNERQRKWEKVVTKRGAEGMAERKMFVEQLEELQESLQMNIRGLSHDIKTPLAVLKTHNAILQMEGNAIDKSELEEILSVQDEAINRITSLVTEMMKAAKDRKPLKSVNPQEIDVIQFAEQLTSRLKALAHGLPIDTAVHLREPVPKFINTDLLMLDRIIDNLLINATKYTQQGRIDVSLSGWTGNFVFEVRDTGRGIAEEDFPKIFQPEGSDTATRESGSYGLGLSLVTLLLAQLGGRLVVESQQGKGSSFRCVLPVEYLPHQSDEGDVANLNSSSLYQKVVSVIPPSGPGA